jgi:hypothetical protein
VSPFILLCTVKRFCRETILRRGYGSTGRHSLADVEFLRIVASELAVTPNGGG